MPPHPVSRLLEPVSAFGALCVGVALAWAPHERLVWQPPRRGRADPAPPPEGVPRLAYAADDGQPLLAWQVDPPGVDPHAVAPTLLAFHGNAELAAWSAPWAHAVAARTGWRVVLPEYRGYAGLGGTPSYAGSQADARAAHAAVRARATRVALFGHSLGSAVAAELAAWLADGGDAPAALLLQSPLASARAMARVLVGARGAALWARHGRVHFDTVARVAALDVPVHVAHGALDLVIPQRMGWAVWRAARRPGGWLGVAHAAHNDVPARGGARYRAWLDDALAAARPAGIGADASTPVDAPERTMRSTASPPPAAMRPPFSPIDTPAALAAAAAAPVALLFKHSERCPISGDAYEEVEAFARRHPELPVWIVDVLDRRSLSLEAAQRFGVRHQSPQAILLREGRAVWDASHFQVRADVLEQKVAQALGDAWPLDAAG